MEIKNDRPNGILIVSLDGKFDGFSSPIIEERLKELISEQDRFAILDMEKVSYLSSAGIRVLVWAHKLLQNKGGEFIICNVTEYPHEVLKMAGFEQLFSILPGRDEAFKQAASSENMQSSDYNRQDLPVFQKNNAIFRAFEPVDKKTCLKVTGDMSKVLCSTLDDDDIFLRRFSETEYSIGLGALGGSPEDYMPVLGEMITIGGTMVWLPTDGHDTPDFLIPRTDTGAVMIHTGLNVSLHGGFNQIMFIESRSDSGISLAELYASIFEIAKERDGGFKGLVSIAMIADMHEVFSSGVKISPIKTNRPENGKMIMDPDNIETWMDINTDPKYSGETMVSFGMGIDLSNDLSGFEKKTLDGVFYMHPANIGDKDMLLHNHGVVFKHMEWSKTVHMDNEVKRIVREGEFKDMRHLLDNTAFKNALIGVSYISNIVLE